jgi:hypothetical protein
VKNLFLNKSAAENAGSTLKASLKERVTEVFPATKHIFRGASVGDRWPESNSAVCFAARRLAGLPVTLHNWEMGKVDGQ